MPGWQIPIQTPSRLTSAVTMRAFTGSQRSHTAQARSVKNENAKIVIRTIDVTETSLENAAMEVIGVTINAENT